MEWLRAWPKLTYRKVATPNAVVLLSHIAALEKQVKDLNYVEAAYQITVANLRTELEAAKPWAEWGRMHGMVVERALEEYETILSEVALAAMPKEPPHD